MKPIEVFEYASLTVGQNGFTIDHLHLLTCFLRSNNEKIFPYYTLINNGVRFNSYVGLLSVGDLTIEVLPKVDKGNDNHDYWKKKLIRMLSVVYKLDVKAPTSASQHVRTNSSIFDVFIKRFLDEVEALLNRGLVKCYHKEEGNLKAMKGKLLVDKHLQKNFVHKERFYVQYNTYDQEHVMNCILRQALVVATRITQNIQLRGRAVTLLFNFPELHEVPVSRELFDNLRFDRKTDDYQDGIKLAKLLLLNFVPDLVAGKVNALALMFDMNKLWEEYVFIMLRKALRKDGYEVKEQVHKSFWHSKNGNKKIIKPDIVIFHGSDMKFVLDTKWKCPDVVPSDGDLHQMFVYQQMFDVKKVALVYPMADNGTNYISKEGFFETGSPCDMLFFPVEMNFSLKPYLI